MMSTITIHRHRKNDIWLPDNKCLFCVSTINLFLVVNISSGSVSVKTELYCHVGVKVCATNVNIVLLIGSKEAQVFIFHAKLGDSSGFKKNSLFLSHSLFHFLSSLTCRGYAVTEPGRRRERGRRRGKKIKPGWSPAWCQGRADSGRVVQDRRRKGGI